MSPPIKEKERAKKADERIVSVVINSFSIRVEVGADNLPPTFDGRGRPTETPRADPEP